MTIRLDTTVCSVARQTEILYWCRFIGTNKTIYSIKKTTRFRDVVIQFIQLDFGYSIFFFFFFEK